ncbi:biliverdin-producing heme oxygenase [Vampirovibrio chlorellavorus]|uniref:biliverdin-producing heme oxygenase n=1 Tax=Vampirovibrio chlorellavorus TaxID=758823 RepID=UPI0026EF8E1F|nr:biliverdin-producing heme oxygenase [Vampirovibrio chlorellavorus]
MISETLKVETAACHDAIENAKRFTRLGSEDFSRDEYVEMLSRFYGFYQPLEAAFRLHPTLMSALHYQQRFKLPLLIQDLTDLGVSQETLDALPLCQDLPPTESEAQALGCMYVMEGSTHGAQFIAKRLQARLQLDDKGLSYYRGYGSQTMSQWKAFKDYLDTTITPTDEPVVVAAATQAFECLQRWMDSDH